MYKEMYYKLFNKITDAMKKIEEAEKILENAQAITEEMYVSGDE